MEEGEGQAKQWSARPCSMVLTWFAFVPFLMD